MSAPIPDEQRTSPIVFRQRPLDVVYRQGWPVVQRYEGEGNGPHVIDVSHAVKLDVQDKVLRKIKPLGMEIPRNPGQSAVYMEGSLIINRLNADQAGIWQLNPDTAVMPEGLQHTDVTDAYSLLALSGRKIFTIAERLSALDMMDPMLTSPFVLQGPFLHVPCQVVVMAREASDGIILVACSRGYGQRFVEALFHVVGTSHIRAAGEKTLYETLAVFKFCS